ncbi:MAG: hypothetical protein IPI77_24095 [Saprospiraceae bacterium]|nr:hypothetical protein [Saprospiraceae bacterium]
MPYTAIIKKPNYPGCILSLEFADTKAKSNLSTSTGKPLTPPVVPISPRPGSIPTGSLSLSFSIQPYSFLELGIGPKPGPIINTWVRQALLSVIRGTLDVIKTRHA